jgi:hypothetical protein
MTPNGNGDPFDRFFAKLTAHLKSRYERLQRRLHALLTSAGFRRSKRFAYWVRDVALSLLALATIGSTLMFLPSFAEGRYGDFDGIGPILGAVMFGFVCFAVYYYLYWALANLYGWKKKTVFATEPSHDPDETAFAKLLESKEFLESRLVTIFAVVISYAWTVYAFAIAYTVLSRTDGAFNLGKLDFESAFYFSLTTIATVGYGDIYPKLTWPRRVVMLEILIGMFYVVSVFAIVATFIRDNKSQDS